MTQTSPHKVLLVDDDRALCELLAEFIQGEGFTVDALHDGQSALDQVQKEGQYDAIVLDIMMPNVSGLDVLQALRKRLTTPIIMLTGRGDDIDRIVGLELGADDYLAKPCNPRELVARIRAVLRRVQINTATAPIQALQQHGIHLDPGQREVTIGGQPVELTSAEFNTLYCLMKASGETLSKSFLTEQVLNRKLTAHDRSIDVHVSRVRQKLAQHPSLNDIIKTVRGSGYQMITDPAGETH